MNPTIEGTREKRPGRGRGMPRRRPPHLCQGPPRHRAHADVRVLGGRGAPHPGGARPPDPAGDGRPPRPQRRSTLLPALLHGPRHRPRDRRSRPRVDGRRPGAGRGRARGAQVLRARPATHRRRQVRRGGPGRRRDRRLHAPAARLRAGLGRRVARRVVRRNDHRPGLRGHDGEPRHRDLRARGQHAPIAVRVAARRGCGRDRRDDVAGLRVRPRAPVRSVRGRGGLLRGAARRRHHRPPLRDPGVRPRDRSLVWVRRGDVRLDGRLRGPESPYQALGARRLLDGHSGALHLLQDGRTPVTRLDPAAPR